MSSIFVPPGTNARQGQQNQINSAASQASGLLPGATGYAKQLQNYATSQFPTEENAVNQLGYSTTQGGRNSMANSYENYAQGQARNEAAQAGSMFGGNTALQQGAQLGAFNDANQSAGNYAAALNSPAGMSQTYAQYANALNTLNPAQGYGDVSSLAGAVYNQPLQPVGQGLGGFLGSALSSWAGGGFKKT